MLKVATQTALERRYRVSKGAQAIGENEREGQSLDLVGRRRKIEEEREDQKETQPERKWKENGLSRRRFCAALTRTRQQQRLAAAVQTCGCALSTALGETSERG